MKRSGKIIGIFVLSVVFIGGGYLAYRYVIIRNHSEGLKKENLILSTEKDQLTHALSQEKKEKEQSILEADTLRNELNELQDARKIKELLSASQARVSKLDADFGVIERENQLLKQTNLTLENRVKNITYEFTQALETLKTAKNEVISLKKGKVITDYIVTIKKNEALLEEKNAEIGALKQKINSIVLDSQNLAKEKKSKEEKIINLNKDKKKLEAEVEKAKAGFDKRNEAQAKIDENFKELNKQLNEKEQARRQLSAEVDDLRRAKLKLDEQLNAQALKISALEEELFKMKDKFKDVKRIEDEKKQIEDELLSAKEEMGKQKKLIVSLEEEKKSILRKEPVSVGEVSFTPENTTADMQDKLNKAYALYDTARAQVVKFSEVLMNKEVELEAAKQKITNLEQELKDVQERYNRTMEDLSRATKLNIALQESIGRPQSYVPKNEAQDSSDKIKAEQLKRELELLLGK